MTENTAPKGLVPVTDAFMFFSHSGLTLGAFAARCKLSVETIVQKLVGAEVGSAAWYTIDQEFRSKLFQALQWKKPDAETLGSGCETLYVAMRGPRGSVRWHHWRVEWETLQALLNASHGDDMLVFSTRDHLNVALNPRHIVTMMYGEEDTDCLMEQVAVVSTQSVTGEEIEFRNDLKYVEKAFVEFKEAVQKWNGDERDVSYLPFAQDRRAPRAFLVDLKRPFMDFAPQTYGHSVDGDDEWHLWNEFGIDDIDLPSTITFTDHDEMNARIQLRREQVTVLECPQIYTTFAEYRYWRDTADDETEFTASEYRKGLVEEGVLSKAEVDEMVSALSELLPDKPAPKAAKSAKPRIRTRAHPIGKATKQGQT